MASKTNIKRELKNIKSEIKSLSEKKQEEAIMLEKGYSGNATGLLEILKYIINENKKTTMLLKSMSDSMERMEGALVDLTDAEQPSKHVAHEELRSSSVKELPLSELDAKIIQILQMNGMACADDIKRQMDYKGRNAASARLNKLFNMGVIQRHQLGRKVYYKFDTGKTTNMLIISPHSKQGPQ